MWSPLSIWWQAEATATSWLYCQMSLTKFGKYVLIRCRTSLFWQATNCDISFATIHVVECLMYFQFKVCCHCRRRFRCCLHPRQWSCRFRWLSSSSIYRLSHSCTRTGDSRRCCLRFFVVNLTCQLLHRRTHGDQFMLPRSAVQYRKPDLSDGDDADDEFCDLVFSVLPLNSNSHVCVEISSSSRSHTVDWSAANLSLHAVQ